MARKKSTDRVEATDYRHSGEKRTNNPPARIAGEGKVPKVEKVRYAYSPHLPPVLRFDPTGRADQISGEIESILRKAEKGPLSGDEVMQVREAVAHYQPWLEWAGKREQHEKGWFEVDPVALHIHERVSAQAIVRTAMREDVQRDLFADPQQTYQQAVQFYRHSVDWANRIILGDSLQVMSSLARRENLAGKVQMIYMDPPYGIKFASNFQPEVGRREVREKDSDLTREPEMIRSFRDTWQLGSHSYLSYLRDRIGIARELLADSGSFFLQIGEENVHRTRAMLDEIFGPQNLIAQITFAKTAGSTREFLPGTCDFLLLYAKDRERVKFRAPLVLKSTADEAGGPYSLLRLRNGEARRMSAEEVQDVSRLPVDASVYRVDNLQSQSIGREKGAGASCWFPILWKGQEYLPGPKSRWKTNEEGMARLALAERLESTGPGLYYVRYIEDFPASPLGDNWADTVVAGFSSDKKYIVETSQKVIARCILMATDPGDLVLDPTCGSGTTGYVAEQWGRRWITIDTSRVAVSIARQRFLTARFDHYRTRAGGDAPSENPGSGFRYRAVSHITLRSVAQNPNLDPIFAKHAPILDEALAACAAALKLVTPAIREKLAAKLRAKPKRETTDADRRRWALPPDCRDRSAAAKKAATIDLDALGWFHWEVPFDTDPDWPKPLQDAVISYRTAWRAKMDEVDACIAANADQEELVDQPEVVRGVVRVSGPFTVEGVRPEELSLGESGLFDPTPNEFDDEPGGMDPRIVNLQAYLSKMVSSLRSDGVTFLGNNRKKFARVEPLFETATGSVIHAEGVWEEGDASGPATVGVTFGPQYGPITATQVEDAIRSARRYDELVVAGFSFDAEASAAIQESAHPKLRIHQAYIRPDMNPAMDGLLKETPGSQLFTVFGQPEVDVRKTKDGHWICELSGVDIYDPVENTVRSSGAEKVAAWFLDQDYDGRCFCITQAFFPDQDAWEKIAKALKGSADPEAFDAFKGTVSIPFPAGKHRRIAVKVIDPRGNEVMAIRKLEG
jgi:adenine-specific DNA-methyltransferase